MSIELRPLGVACNLSCHYCYQNPQRDAGNQRMTYDLEKMKREAARIGGPFTLFGGEPLLIRFKDLEELFAWGLETFGSSSIQTNGVLIEDRHIDLFRRYKVSVGISIDGPGELNDARWHRGLNSTRRSTAAVESAIERLCQKHEPPGLIITLHKGNATAEKLPLMEKWLQRLHSIGIRSVRLHLLEVDHQAVRDSLSLTPGENVQALLAFADVQGKLPGMHFDLFEEMEALLCGRDADVGCVWRACDPYTTEAVQGVEGNGQSSNCGRTNKEGISFIKADATGYERYLALYATPQAENGCAGCRFFLVCKGQCPGTAVGGDWRNRTEHCQEWKSLFGLLERRLIVAGRIPLTIQPLRFELENRQIRAWQAGRNPSIGKVLSEWREDLDNESIVTTDYTTHTMVNLIGTAPRITWVAERAREMWEQRLKRLPVVIDELSVRAARVSADRCTIRIVPDSRFNHLLALSDESGLAAAILPTAALPNGIYDRSIKEGNGVLLVGNPSAIASAQAAWSKRDMVAFRECLDLPMCCATPHSDANTREHFLGYPENIYLPASIAVHPLLAPLGISALPILPCHLDCPQAVQAADQWLQSAAAFGYDIELGWLREIFSWSILWTELHGVTEVMTPLFKMCFQNQSGTTARMIRREGTALVVEGAIGGLKFPYVAPARRTSASLGRTATRV